MHELGKCRKAKRTEGEEARRRGIHESHTSYGKYKRISKRKDNKKGREESEGPPCSTGYVKVTSIEGERGDSEKREGERRRNGEISMNRVTIESSRAGELTDNGKQALKTAVKERRRFDVVTG